MRTVVLHGVPVETTNEGAAEVVALQSELVGALKKLAARNGELDAMKSRHAVEMAAVSAHVMSPEAMDAAVESRIAVIEAAKTILGAQFDPRGKSEMMIRRMAAEGKLGEAKLTGKDDAYVTVVFDTLVAAMQNTDPVQGSTSPGISSTAATKAYDVQIAIHKKLDGAAHPHSHAGIERAIRLCSGWVQGAALNQHNHYRNIAF